MPDNKFENFISRPQDRPDKKLLEVMNTTLSNLWMHLVGYGFSLLYNQLAWSYDAVSWFVSLGAWRNWQRSSLPYIRGQKVLEIAHGPGHMLLELYQAGFQVTGIDLSSQMGRIAKRRVTGVHAPIPILRSSAQALPFAPQTFDSILATFPSEFILDPLTLQAAHRSLKTDGVFIIIPEAQFTSRSVLVKAVDWLFKVTGQRNADLPSGDLSTQLEKDRLQSIMETFNTSGFSLKIETVSQMNSKVTVLIARKTKLGLTRG
jgi:ubiquinone/menaquinone biosynthesis C-methylase UbiE